MHAVYPTQLQLGTEDVPVIKNAPPFANHYVMPMTGVEDMLTVPWALVAK